MGMPQIPDGKNRPNFNQTIIDLLESIALEEMAIAHIINAEGEKLQEVTKRYACNDLCYCELQENCKNTHGIINSLIMKEWLLLTKMGAVIELKDNSTFCEKSKFNPEKEYFKSKC